MFIFTLGQNKLIVLVIVLILDYINLLMAVLSRKECSCGVTVEGTAVDA